MRVSVTSKILLGQFSVSGLTTTYLCKSHSLTPPIMPTRMLTILFSRHKFIAASTQTHFHTRGSEVNGRSLHYDPSTIYTFYSLCVCALETHIVGE